jgi:predicted DNA-binding ribbon-helix-helix protein
MHEIAMAKGTTRPSLIKEINQTRSNANLSSAIRVFVLPTIKAQGDEAQAQWQAAHPELCYSLAVC